jgi:uncharacterized repeat protein (TIGR02543 family)
MPQTSTPPATSIRPSPLGALLVLLVLLFANPAGAYQLNSQEDQLAKIFTSASGQNRPSLTLDPTLSQVAHARAADMARRDYFSHVNPDGVAANYLVIKAGYTLPASWGNDPKANNIESISAGYPTASEAWKAWMNSSPHRTHLLALDPFFADQTNFGVGFAYDASSTYGYYWVIITAPPQPQAIVVQSPAANSEVTAASLTASGTADATGVDHLEFAIENAAGTGSYAKADGVAQWSAQITGLLPGPNTLHLRSLDATGNVINSVAVSFVYAVHSTLTVTVSGSGSVTSGFAGATDRLIGVSYKATATPAPGWVFVGWTGDLDNAGATLNFTMTDSLSLTANFIPDPFKANLGVYQGLPEFNGATGILQLKLNAKGGFSGRLALPDGTAFRFKGMFDLTGISQVQLGSTTAAFHFDVRTGAMSVTIGGIETALDHYTGSAGALAGHYNIALPGTPLASGSDCPDGTGCAVLKISAPGSVRITGKLGDATAFSYAGFLSNDGGLPVFVSAGKGVENVAGELVFSSTGAHVTGDLAWSRKAVSKAALFSKGFDAIIHASGDRYSPVDPGQPPLSNSTLTLGSGNLGTEIVNSIVSGVDASNGGVTLRVNADTGFVSGQFVHPADGRKRSFSGVILPSQSGAFGYFVGVNETGYVSLLAK